MAKVSEYVEIVDPHGIVLSISMVIRGRHERAYIATYWRHRLLINSKTSSHRLENDLAKQLQMDNISNGNFVTPITEDFMLVHNCVVSRNIGTERSVVKQKHHRTWNSGFAHQRAGLCDVDFGGLIRTEGVLSSMDREAAHTVVKSYQDFITLGLGKADLSKWTRRNATLLAENPIILPEAEGPLEASQLVWTRLIWKDPNSKNLPLKWSHYFVGSHVTPWLQSIWWTWATSSRFFHSWRTFSKSLGSFKLLVSQWSHMRLMWRLQID